MENRESHSNGNQTQAFLFPIFPMFSTQTLPHMLIPMSFQPFNSRKRKPLSIHIWYKPCKDLTVEKIVNILGQFWFCGHLVHAIIHHGCDVYLVNSTVSCKGWERVKKPCPWDCVLKSLQVWETCFKLKGQHKCTSQADMSEIKNCYSYLAAQNSINIPKDGMQVQLLGCWLLCKSKGTLAIQGNCCILTVGYNLFTYILQGKKDL